MSDLIETGDLPDEVLFTGEGDVLAVPFDGDRPAWTGEDDGYEYLDGAW
jgi:hypothetical protein